MFADVMSAVISPLFSEFIFLNCKIIEPIFEILLLLSRTFKKVVVRLCKFALENNFNKILSFSSEFTNGLLITCLNSELSFNAFCTNSKSFRISSIHFFSEARS